MELFHFDIETATNHKNYHNFLSEDERGALLFKSKYEKMNWQEKITNQ